MPIDPLTDPYVVEGRVVTMGSQGVLANGAIYIADGRIEAVQRSSTAPPPGFGQATRIRTGDTLYPGMIELHNHLSYNAMPLWDVPQKYANNGQWRGKDGYRREITKPSQVLGGTAGVVEALVRFVECRALLGGVTTTQGISLSSEPGIKRFYKGVVRNVEQPLDPGLPRAGTSIGNPASNQAEAYLEKLTKHSCYLQHMSEGVDKTARGWFQRLKMANGDWAINDAFCGIHNTALREEDLHLIAQRKGSMVWSPLSNYLLYGDTVKLDAVKRSGILTALGSDWAPSGSKNLLGELKVAWLASQENGAVFSAEELVAMVTTNPARIAHWDNLLGSIEAGKRADLIAINGQTGNDFMRLIEARETSVTLVMIDGVPRAGQPRLMNRFGQGTERIRVGRSVRVLNLAQADADPLVGSLTLGAATARLGDAMTALPRLAAELDTAGGDAGLFAGSEDSTGKHWHISFDFEDDDAALDLAQGLAAQPLASFVDQPMQLEGITVADDPTHLRKLVAARNLPEFVKEGLPPLYGEHIALPEAAEFLVQTERKLAPQLLATTRDLATFMRSSGELTLADRKILVDQALLLLEENYVHLPLKRAMHAVDPVQRLNLMRYRLEEAVEGELPPEIEFHNELGSTFNSLRDLHTSYRLPGPFRGKVAWLPFFIEEYRERGQRKYMVTRLVGDAGPASFRPGVEVTHWNGMRIQQAVQHNAERQAGSNEAARYARGLNSLTIRPLGRGLPPEGEWVTLHYLDVQGEKREWTQAWLLFEPGTGPAQLQPGDLRKEASALGLDDHTEDIQQAKKVLYAPAVARRESREMLQGKRTAMRNVTGGLPTFLPGILQARTVTYDGEQYGSIRIFSFNVANADEFVGEFVRLAEQLPDNGLIIDVRGNGGGLIYAAEQLLQVLTPRHIEPERAQFINSAVNLQICRNHARSTRFPGLDLGKWIASIEQSVETGATFSLGYPITDPARCNEIGQRYFGPVVLIVDPLCYSATDIFAAGFKDHRIGPIIGVGENTGAGGANVWSHALLQRLMLPDRVADISSPYQPLPHGADLRVAIRRTVRVGENAGDMVEDLGIVPDRVYHLTRADVLGRNEDLLAASIEFLKGKQAHPIRMATEHPRDRLPVIKIHTRNVDRIDATVDGRQVQSLYPRRGVSRIELEDVIRDVHADKVVVEAKGYQGEQLVVCRREGVELH